VVAHLLGESARGLKTFEHAALLSQEIDAVSEVEPYVDARFKPRRSRGEMGERGKSALEMRNSLTDRSPSDGLGGGFPEARDRLLPVLTFEGMVGEALDVFRTAIGVEMLDGICDSRVQGSPPFLEKAGVGDVVRERVFEGELEIGEETRFVDELRSLEPRESVAYRVVILVADGPKQTEGHMLADDRASLEKQLIL